MERSTWISFLCILTSCGYHYGQSGVLPSYQTIAIPYVQGDPDGALTASLIKEVSQSGAFEYRYEGGALLLDVAIIDTDDENVGFRYDLKKNGKLKKRLIPDETRTTMLAEVSVKETASGKVLLGPVRLSADVTFDHDFYSSRNGINVFSLGQLSDIDEARDAAQCPLHQALARKIVDYITNDW